MDPKEYIQDVLSGPNVPEYCVWTAWLGTAFKMEDYSNFIKDVEIARGCNGRIENLELRTVKPEEPKYLSRRGEPS